MPNTPSERPERFGIEIEMGGDTDRAIEALVNAGIRVSDQRNTHLGHHATRWTMKYDGTVTTGTGSRRDGFELVSPPLNFNDPTHRAQVDTVLEALRAAGCRPVNRAGIHVHVEAIGMNAQQLANVGRFFYRFQDAFYRIASSGWRTIRSGAASYAKPIPDEHADKLTRVRNETELRSAIGNSYGDIDRYHAVNYDSYFIQGTIEFRCFNSSLNNKRVQGWIALCIAIVRDARNGQRRSIGVSYKLGDMANGQADPAKVILKLQQILRGNTARYPAVMSAEDWKLVRFCWRESTSQRIP